MSKRKSSINWKKIEEDYHARIQSEIDSGKNPVERYLLEKTPEEIKEIQAVPHKQRRKMGPQNGQTRVISRERVKELHAEKYTNKEIANILDCSAEQIRRIVRNELELTPHRDLHKQRRQPKHSYETYQEVYGRLGSYKLAAEELDVSDSTVRYALTQSLEARSDRQIHR